MDSKTVPLLDEKGNVIGDAVLEERKDGTYATCTFNHDVVWDLKEGDSCDTRMKIRRTK